MPKKLLVNFAFWSVFFLIFGILQILVETKTISPSALPLPSETLVRLYELTLDGTLPKEGLLTAARAIAGLTLGIHAGSLAAISIFCLGMARPSGIFLLDFLRSIPVACHLPLIIAVAGIDTSAHIAMASIGVATLTAVTFFRGLIETEKRFWIVTHLFNPNGRFKVFKIYLPGAAPFFYTALRLSVSAALVLVILAEMFMGSSAGGLGRFISDKTYGDDRAGQFAAVLFAGMIGYSANILLELSIASLFRLKSGNVFNG